MADRRGAEHRRDAEPSALSLRPGAPNRPDSASFGGMWKYRSPILGFFAGVAGLALPSCSPPTAFEGSAQFPGGALGCFKQCQKVGMEMASYVYVGEYSTACACRPKLATTQEVSVQEDAADEASMVAASAGVEVQRRRLQEQQQRAQQNAMMPR